MHSASLPPFISVYLCANVGPRGATRHSACPLLCHSESGPLGLSVRECGARGLLVVRLPALFVPHSASLGPAMATGVLSTPLPVSAPPTGLDECFFFISLVVGLPCGSICCQFWLFFVFKLLLSFFWLCEEAQCVYLRLHLGWKLLS